ncbi:polyhydroxyalkanoic acid system family protein [uncultured Desulfobacter sp.]|uniref:polyhydroxyalkanoic acid system family protein n=1 Tax=uncultured Desulfobacter sp. TaxID=240139 RepID=UPI0029F47A2B|nr:polyhydroxyalkanoic acid system family protein [uncultured Desulfobacter sp.]
MADININKSHSLEISDARARLEKMAGELQAQYGIKSAWTGNTAILSGTGLKKGRVELTDSVINVQITLGFLAKAMKGKVQEQVDIALDNALS